MTFPIPVSMSHEFSSSGRAYKHIHIFPCKCLNIEAHIVALVFSCVRTAHIFGSWSLLRRRGICALAYIQMDPNGLCIGCDGRGLGEMRTRILSPTKRASYALSTDIVHLIHTTNSNSSYKGREISCFGRLYHLHLNKDTNKHTHTHTHTHP